MRDRDIESEKERRETTIERDHDKDRIDNTARERARRYT